MANTKASAFPAITTLAAADTLPLVQGGVTSKMTGTQLATFIGLRKLDDQSTASGATLTLTVPTGTFHTLVVDLVGRLSATSVATYMQFNADTAANYDAQGIIDSNATITATGPTIATANPRVGVLVPSTAVAGAIGQYRITIENADSATLRKSWHFTGGRWDSDAAAGAFFESGHGQWRNTANAITSVLLGVTSGTFITARAVLYGYV